MFGWSQWRDQPRHEARGGIKGIVVERQRSGSKIHHSLLLVIIYLYGRCRLLPVAFVWLVSLHQMYAHLNDLFVEFVRVRFKSLELLGGYMGFAWQFGNIYTYSRTYSSTALGISNTESQRYAAAHLGSSRIRETTKLPRKKCSKTKKSRRGSGHRKVHVLTRDTGNKRSIAVGSPSGRVAWTTCSLHSRSGLAWFKLGTPLFEFPPSEVPPMYASKTESNPMVPTHTH